MKWPTIFPSEGRVAGIAETIRWALATAALLLGPLDTVHIAAAQTGAAADPELPEEALRKVALAAGYVAEPAALADDGTIVASATEGDIEERSLSVFDGIHVTPVFDGRPPVAGDTLLLYRDMGELRHPGTGESLGRIVHPTGLAAVTSPGDEVASAVIVEGFAPVVAGQSVQYLRRSAVPMPAAERVPGEGVVVGFRDPAAIVEPYAVLYLDLAPGADLEAGGEVRLFRVETEEGRTLPEIHLGMARVLDVGPTAATALVLRLDRSDLSVGDRYRPALAAE